MYMFADTTSAQPCANHCLAGVKQIIYVFLLVAMNLLYALPTGTIALATIFYTPDIGQIKI